MLFGSFSKLIPIELIVLEGVSSVFGKMANFVNFGERFTKQRFIFY